MDDISAGRIVGCILAGGRSTRMRRDKASMELGGRPLVERVAGRLGPQVGHLVVNANASSDVHRRLGVPVVADTLPGHAGPLAGVLAALRHAEAVPSASHVVTAPVDAPFLPGDLVARLSGALASPSDVAIAASCGRIHPVFALWPMEIAGALETWLKETADFSMRAWMDRCTVRVVDFPLSGGIDPFFNVNAPEDLTEAERLLGAGR